jgi:hypothetical protein
VRAAFFAAADLARAGRFLALERACRDSARFVAAARPSFFNALRTAMDRFRETFCFPPRAPLAASLAA